MKTMIGVIVMLVVLGSTINQAVLADYASCFKKCDGSCSLGSERLCNVYCSKMCRGQSELKKPENLATNSDSKLIS
ncbi:unnamed protein product [Linum trigynum]|uniref:Uncharacterized protein n=1 Tax=Linum trigynum TaxID=586398 RepID=A0AAV2EJP3_9ROSI